MTDEATEKLLMKMREKILTALDSFRQLKQMGEDTGYDYSFELDDLIRSTKVLSQKIEFDIACFYDEDFDFEEIE